MKNLREEWERIKKELRTLEGEYVSLEEGFDYIKRIYDGICEQEHFYIKMIEEVHIYVKYPCGCIAIDRLKVKDGKFIINKSKPIETIREDLLILIRMRNEDHIGPMN